MPQPDAHSWFTPSEAHLGLRRIRNGAGLIVSALPNGTIFAIEHSSDSGAVLINQVLGSPIDGGIGRIVLRVGGSNSINVEAVGPRANVRFGVGHSEIAWEGDTNGIRHRVTLQLHADIAAWLWRVEVTNASEGARPIDAILIQDLGLGVRGFVANNEAYASQYIDHHIARDARLGPVVMSRQNLAQDGKHPWLMQGCLDGASAFATDAMQLFGPGHRDADGMGLLLGTSLADRRLQHEVSCVAIQSLPITLEPRSSAAWRFFALFEADHPLASHDEDVAKLASIAWPDRNDVVTITDEPRRSLLQDARSADTLPLSHDALAQRYSDRLLEEFDGDDLLSFFTPDPPHNRHVVLRSKERIAMRRHGAVLRSGKAMLPDDSTLAATCWMHGMFAAQLTIGNTSLHKLFSVSRDPYNITRASGLRVMVDAGKGWRLLTVPSAFEMGLSDCRWIYSFADRVVTVHAIVSGDDPAMQWRITTDGAPCRLLVFGHLVLGECELEHRASVLADPPRRRFTFRPDPESPWGQRYPDAAYHLVTSTPDAIEIIGGDELLYSDGRPGGGTHVAIRTRPTSELCFAVVGSLTDATEAERLAAKYEQPSNDADHLASTKNFWTTVTRGARIVGDGPDVGALNASLPWLAHDAMIHLTVPRGLEQYTAAAWGTRDVCQGPVEFLLALEHDEPVKRILQIVFAEQSVTRGDWPQWFMLEPYSSIRDQHSHGDVIVWPLKALNDYLEATDDLAFLDEAAPWRDDDTLERTAREDTIAAHVDKLLATVRERFIPGTSLIRYGEGDWNDSLQPADPGMRDAMVSSWTVALLYQQLLRYAAILRRCGRNDAAKTLSDLAAAMRADFNRLLVRDEVVAGYALFEPGSDTPELLLHPADKRTGLMYSLLPMTRSIIAGLFTPEQARHHLQIIRAHLLFPDGARLMDRPVAYHGGPEQTFRRAESASYFGREIGLMYTHAHLRYGEAMAVLGEADALWDALHVANPISVTERVANAAPRQRNAYFSSSDADFADRYEASDAWSRVKAGSIVVEGGWRVYSSGPGLYVRLLIQHAFGIRRAFGTRVNEPVLPPALAGLTVEFDSPA
ncbi:MAG TPA: cellobiose phosphorylase [Casimicrobiaceae bacterium]|nr:cellobiose phosphorylase [Casimicrobiaceae bacterium]